MAKIRIEKHSNILHLPAVRQGMLDVFSVFGGGIFCFWVKFLFLTKQFFCGKIWVI